MRSRSYLMIVCMILILGLTTAWADNAYSTHSNLAKNSGTNWVCPVCNAELRTQEGFNNDMLVWTCKSCGAELEFPTKDTEGFDPVEAFRNARFPGIYWYCDGCDSFLNKQEGFDDHLDHWECTVCGYVNTISDEDILDDPITSDLEQDNLGNTIPENYLVNGLDYSIGNSLFWGHYEQDNDTSNGPEPIEWIVLDRTQEMTLLISKNPLDYQPYNETKADTSWAESSLRAWLNNSFLDTAFFPVEQDVISITTVDNGEAQYTGTGWTTHGGASTKDQVFLLSFLEFSQYIESDSIVLSNYVKEHGAHSVFSDNKTWWLRSPGKDQKQGCFVGNGKAESAVVTDKRCIRPVIWIVDSAVDWEKSAYNRATKALALAEQGHYDEAVPMLDLLGNYYGSKYYSLFYRVQAGNAAFENSQFSEAITWYSSAKSFIEENYEGKEAEKLVGDYNINPQLLESRYQYAIECMEVENYETAIDLLTTIGQYQDSMKMLLKCYEKCRIACSPIIYAKESAVNTGLDNGYSEKKPIRNGDPHFNLDLGYFMMSGYTEKSYENDIPVFVKTPGDNMILWFVLTEDINALKNNKNLFIARDTNGSDSEFQIQEPDFGRGTLFVKHTDANGWANPIVPYKDFLAAHDDTGANTKVEIKEEGTYEVALDYEIGQRGKVVVVDKTDYNDYRLRFTFKVRNGSGMFFLYDIGSGTELQDYSTTSAGFKVDLKHSNTLRIDITRSDLNQKWTALDVRKTTRATDGDSFTETGYYEISVTNTQTQGKLTKHIFVGSAEDLETYKSVEPVLLAKFE